MAMTAISKHPKGVSDPVVQQQVNMYDVLETPYHKTNTLNPGTVRQGLIVSGIILAVLTISSAHADVTGTMTSTDQKQANNLDDVGDIGEFTMACRAQTNILQDKLRNLIGEVGRQSECLDLIDQHLGKASHDECIAAAGTTHGNHFDDYSVYVSNGKITALELNERESDNKLTGMRVQYGSVFTPWRGTSYGTVHQLHLDGGETIVSLKMYVGEISPWRGVIGLQLTTDRRSIVSTYGTTTEDVYSTVNATWDELRYFSGSHGAILDQIMAHARGCHSVESFLVG